MNRTKSQAKKYLRIFLVLLTAVLFSGCWGGRETDEVALVLAVGFDKGQHQPLEVTLSIANPKAFSAETGGQEEPFFNVSVEGPSIWECYTLLNTFVSRETSFFHTQAYIFGEDLAREGIGRYIYAMTRQREARRNSSLYICRGKAKDFIEKNKPPLETSLAKEFYFIDRTSQYTGLFYNHDLHDYYTSWKSLHGSTLALVGVQEKNNHGAKDDSPLQVPYEAGQIPKSGGNLIEFIGTAVFNDDKMVGELTGDETRTLLLLQGEFGVSNFTLTDPRHKDKIIMLRLRQARKPQIQFREEAGQLKISQTVFLEGEFLSIQSGENYEVANRQKMVEDTFDQEMEELAHGLIEKTKERNWNDIFHYDKTYRREVRNWQEWRSMNWNDIYRQAEFTVDFKTNIRRPGTMRNTFAPLQGE